MWFAKREKLSRQLIKLLNFGIGPRVPLERNHLICTSTDLSIGTDLLSDSTSTAAATVWTCAELASQNQSTSTRYSAGGPEVFLYRSAPGYSVLPVAGVTPCPSALLNSSRPTTLVARKLAQKLESHVLPYSRYHLTGCWSFCHLQRPRTVCQGAPRECKLTIVGCGWPLPIIESKCRESINSNTLFAEIFNPQFPPARPLRHLHSHILPAEHPMAGFPGRSFPSLHFLRSLIGTDARQREHSAQVSLRPDSRCVCEYGGICGCNGRV